MIGNNFVPFKHNKHLIYGINTAQIISRKIAIFN